MFYRKPSYLLKDYLHNLFYFIFALFYWFSMYEDRYIKYGLMYTLHNNN